MFIQLFQITTLPQGPDYATLINEEVETSAGFPIWAMVLIAALVVLFVYLLRIFWRRLTALRASFKMVVLQVMLPRDVGHNPDKQEKITPQSIQEQIGVADVFWSAIGGLKAQKKYKAWLPGRNDHMSFEMVAQDGLISFYISVPDKLKNFIEQQVQAHYPYAVLEEIGDYNIFKSHGSAVGASLKYRRSWAFPIKTYKSFETDPLNAVTNALAKIDKNDGAAIQIVVRSAYKRWRKRGIHIASAMQQGKSLSEASGLGMVVRVLNFFGDFINISGNNHKSEAKQNYKLSPLEEQMVKGIEEKASKAGLDVTIRILATSDNAQQAQNSLNNLMNAFSQYNIYQYGNGFKIKKPFKMDYFMYNYVHRIFDEWKHMVMNSEELASLFHFPLPTTETPNIKWLSARKAPPPINMPAEGLLLGISEYRGSQTQVKMSPEDRARHFYVIGKSGTGKSVLMENMAVQDIKAGEGVCVIDPHGDLVEAILSQVPPERAEDVILFDPADIERPLGLNLMEFDAKYPEQKSFVINEMIKILDKLYDLRQTGGPIFEQYMRNAMQLIMEDVESGATLMEISKVLSDAEYRKFKLSKTQNPITYDFWVKEAQKAGGDASLANMVPYITSKLNQFVANDIMRPIIGQQKSAFNLRQVMDQRKILLVKLSKGKLGDLNAHLLGLVMVGKILMAALSRTDVPQEQRPNFYLYVDEFQNFITDSIATILSEARKYRLNLIIAHQYIGQLVGVNKDTKIRDAVFGNVGTIACFRVGVEDAEFLAKEFAPVFTPHDVINLELYSAYAKLLINNTPSRPFNFRTLAPGKGDLNLANKYRELSRLKYGRPRAEIEQEIFERSKLEPKAV